MSQRRPRARGGVTISDLAGAYDRAAGGRSGPAAARAPAPVVRPRRRERAVTQGDVRLTRLKARAAGIRFALQYENQTASQARVLRQILQNLELAIRGMEMALGEA